MSWSFNVDHLRSLVVIADCGSFSRAAAALGVAQSTLSHRVQLLEGRVDAPLFDRESRPLKLTQRGEELLFHAREIVDAHDRALDRLGASRLAPVTLGVTDHFATNVLSHLRGILESTFPGLNTRYQIGSSNELARRVGDGTVDLALVMNHDDTLPGREVARLRLHWIAAAGWSPAELAKTPMPFVALTGTCAIRARAERLLSSAGISYDHVGRAANVQQIMTMVESGLGLSLLPIIGPLDRHLTTVDDVLPEAGLMPINLICSPSLAPNIASEALRTTVDFFAGLPVA